MNKKKVIIVSILLLLTAVVVLIILLQNKEETMNNNNIVNTYEPEFMSTDEKSSFDLSADSKIQVLKRSDEGKIDIYKIIREESDIVYDIEAANKPIDPRY